MLYIYISLFLCCGVDRGKGLFTVKGDVGFLGRDIPRSCLQLLRHEDLQGGEDGSGAGSNSSLRARLSKKAGAGGEAGEKVAKVSKRHVSYQKAQEVARQQDLKVGGGQEFCRCCISAHVHLVMSFYDV